jgi:hypothetical protein
LNRNETKEKVKSLAAELAQQEVERTGKDYQECISWAIDEACERLGVSKKEFIMMFLLNK